MGVYVHTVQMRFVGQCSRIKEIMLMMMINYESQVMNVHPQHFTDGKTAPTVCDVIDRYLIPIGNESVPIQLAQCWFAGLAIFNAKV